MVGVTAFGKCECDISHEKPTFHINNSLKCQFEVCLLVGTKTQNCHIIPDVHIYIYIYIAVELLTGPSLGVFKVINWSKFVFFKTLFVNKHYKMGFWRIFAYKKIARANFQSY